MQAVDVAPPSRPGDVTAFADVDHDITVAWSASSDDVGVTGDTVYQGSHWYQVRARDAAGNEGHKTAPVRVDIDPAGG